MKVGVLGTGVVGKSLGKGFVSLGHEVCMGTRDAKNPKAVEWALEMGQNAASATFADAAAFGDIVVLATMGSANAQVLASIPQENLEGKLVIDTTNPLDFSTGAPQLSVGHTDSGGAQVQRALPEAHVVKAFNTVSAPNMFKPQFEGGPPDMFLCGNNEDAKQKAAELIAQFGWGIIDVGGIGSSRYLEAMAMVWTLHGLQVGSWGHAFKMLHK